MVSPPATRNPNSYIKTTAFDPDKFQPAEVFFTLSESMKNGLR